MESEQGTAGLCISTLC